MEPPFMVRIIREDATLLVRLKRIPFRDYENALAFCRDEETGETDTGMLIDLVCVLGVEVEDRMRWLAFKPDEREKAGVLRMVEKISGLAD